MLKLFKKYLKPYKWRVAVMIILTLFTAVGSLMLPTVMGMIVDNGIKKADFNAILIYSAIMFAIAVFIVLLQLLNLKIQSYVTAGFISDMRKDIFVGAMNLPYDEFNKIGTGGLITRSTEDMWLIQDMLMTIISGIFSVPIMLIGGTVLAFMRDKVLALLVFAFVPIMIVVIIILGKKVIKAWDTSEKYMDKQNSLVRDRLLGIRVIRAFNKENDEHKKIAKATDVMAANIIKNNVYGNSLQPIATFVLNIVIVAILYFATVRVGNPDASITSGSLMAIIEYVGLVMNGIIMLSFGLVMLPRTVINARRINEVLEAKKIPAATDLSKPPLNGNVEFKNVTFCFSDATVPALTDVSFKINKGERVAFIGGTGSGKSTIITLLLKFRDPSSGNIYFDGEDSNDISAQRIHENCSAALQKATIFSGTIKENIMLGNENATNEELNEAVATSQLGEFVSEQKDGLDFAVNQGGTNLSGGQKQRISLARALIKTAPIYIFDDTFSALDFLTESKIRNKLSTVLKGKTQIIITQRVASAMSADNIFVVDGGKVVASGKHNELLNGCKIYRDIYLSQSGGNKEKNDLGGEL